MSYVKCQVHLPDGAAITIDVGRDSVIREILLAVGFVTAEEFVVFTGKPEVNYATPIVNLDNTMTDINMYHSGKDYLAEISVSYKADIDKYNVELYTMYMDMHMKKLTGVSCLSIE